jgi:hypothetical protein
VVLDVTELSEPEVLAGQCTGSGCCYGIEIEVTELAEPEVVAGQCTGSGCCYGIEVDE